MEKRRSSEGSSKGSETRQEIVEYAVGIAAREGLGGLSFGRLAEELKMSKSGLFVHFGSKEQLERAVIDQAGNIFSEHVLLPAHLNVPEGIVRVWNVCDFWLKFADERVLPGGYFFTGAFFECARHHGPVAHAITAIVQEWFRHLREVIDGARRSGDISKEVDAKELAFELNSILIGGQWSHLLAHRDYDEGRFAILQKLRSVATDKIPESAFASVRAWRKHLANRST